MKEHEIDQDTAEKAQELIDEGLDEEEAIEIAGNFSAIHYTTSCQKSKRFRANYVSRSDLPSTSRTRSSCVKATAGRGRI